MAFGRELSHLVAEQINRAALQGGPGGSSGGAGQSGGDASKVALLEANLQRLAEQVATYMSAQKKSKRNMVDYGLEVFALHGMRVAITGGRAIFANSEDPFDAPFMYLELARGSNERQIRYIYLTSEGNPIESTTDPSNIDESYLPLAMVDIWSNTNEIIQDRIQDIRPKAGSVYAESEKESSGQFVGNVSLNSPDTGNDSFLVSETNPAGLKVKVSSGRALVDGEVIDAEGGILDLVDHSKVVKEFVAISDGIITEYSLYHQSIQDVVVYINDEVASGVTISESEGKITLAEAPEAGAAITVSYTFSGNYMLTFIVEKVKTNEGKPLGIINWRVGSNRTPLEPPTIDKTEHVIGKIDMSGSITVISSGIIDNAYEVVNLTQEDLQYGEKLGTTSLQDASITANKIVANAITSNHISAGSIDAAKIQSGAILAQHIASGAIEASHIAAGTITADMITGGTISADKFEDSTWGDLTQAIHYVKNVLKNSTSWRKALTLTDLSIGEFSNVSYNSEEFPTLRLKNKREWDKHSGNKLPVEIPSVVGHENSDLWDFENWDIPVYESGYWESGVIDYGQTKDLQAEFWVKPLIGSAARDIKVSFRYCVDKNDLDASKWSAYEKGAADKAMGALCWAGTLRKYRYVKIKVELATSDPNQYELLGYPEVRIADCQNATVGDIRFPAMSVKQGELRLIGYELERASYPALWTWALENRLVVDENTWKLGYNGYFSSGDNNRTFRIPDLRGDFFRVMDEGRGIDPGRGFGNEQGDAIRNIVGNTWKYDRAWDFSDDLMAHTGVRTNIATGSGGSDNWCGLYQFNAGRVVPVAGENRPRNMAYFACIRFE